MGGHGQVGGPGTGIPPTGDGVWLSWLSLAGPGCRWLAGYPGTLASLRKISHRTGITEATRVQAKRVEIHERGGSAKGNLILGKSKSTGTISSVNTLEE